MYTPLVHINLNMNYTASNSLDANTSNLDNLMNTCIEHNPVVHRVTFVILLILQIPSIIVCLIIFNYYAFHQDKIYDSIKVLLILLSLDFVYLTGKLEE